MTLCLLPYTLSLFVAQQGWLSCYYLKMNYNIIISTCSYCIVCIIHKDLLFILFFLIYNRIGLSPICVIRTYVCPNMDNWTAATIVREVSAEQRLGEGLRVGALRLYCSLYSAYPLCSVQYPTDASFTSSLCHGHRLVIRCLSRSFSHFAVGYMWPWKAALLQVPPSSLKILCWLF